MTTMVEKVEKAIGGMIGAALYGGQPTTLGEVARAAIEAMMEPTPEMLKAVEDEEVRQGYVHAAYECMSAEDGWPVMIQAALKEGQE